MLSKVKLVSGIEVDVFGGEGGLFCLFMVMVVSGDTKRNGAVVKVIFPGYMKGWRGLDTEPTETRVAAYSSASCITNLI